jgi:FkbM family methyltransferase
MRFFTKLLERVPPSWVHAGSTIRGRSRLVKRATDWLPNLLRNHEGRIQSGLGRGLRFNGGDSAVGFLFGTHDTDVQAAFSQLLRPNMTCYDVGANVGFTAILAARCVESGGKVICFEPVPENSRQIQTNADLNGFKQIQIHQIALGETDGQAEFRMSYAPTWGRLSEAGASTPDESGTTVVPVRTLDSLSTAGAIPDPQFIKMDVEGAEAGVLAGARKLLERAQPVMIIELHHTHDAVMEALSGLDYVVRPLTPGWRTDDTDGEYQVLAYPVGRSDCETFSSKFMAQEKMVFG